MRVAALPVTHAWVLSVALGASLAWGEGRELSRSGRALDVRVVLSLTPPAAGRAGRGLRAEIVAPALRLRREVFSAREPCACAASADNLAGELTFDCWGEGVDVQGRAFIESETLVLELVDTYARSTITERLPLPANTRVRFFGARRSVGLPLMP